MTTLKDLQQEINALLTAKQHEINKLRQKLMKMSVQRDEWKERATRYRKQLLEKTQ